LLDDTEPKGGAKRKPQESAIPDDRALKECNSGQRKWRLGFGG
jgi:hypothetical protein